MNEAEKQFYAVLAERAEAEDYCPLELLPVNRQSDAEFDAFLATALSAIPDV